MGLLDGKVVVVTGAAHGMGERHAQFCAEQGAQVVATDIQADLGASVAARIGGRCRFVHHDVTDPASWAAVVRTAVEAFGRVDGLVNNAAVISHNLLEDESFDNMERIYQVNVFGTWWGIKSVVPAMRDAGGGSIVNISSTAGLRAFPTLSAYGSSKWAVRGLTKFAALELGGYGIRVNSVHPGAIKETGMFPADDTEEQRTARLAHVPLARFGERDDISGTVVFLLSDLSTFVTGVEHVVDGGTVV